MISAEKRIAILLVLLISLIGLSPVRANPGVHVGTQPPGQPPGSPFTVGQGIYITYYTDVGENGNAGVFINYGPGTADIWDSGYSHISGGLAYDVTAPGLSTPGTYYAGVTVFLDGGGQITGYSAFQVVGGTPTTDWAVLSVGLNPSTPHIGDSVQFTMVMTALSTTGSWPRSVSVQCLVDGSWGGTFSVTFPGPTGASATVYTTTPWIATVGTHTLTWTISTANDPNPGNNQMSTSFTVQPSAAQFDFSISLSSTGEKVTPGGSASCTVTVNMVSGPAQNVALSATGEPSGVTVSFNPTSGTSPFTSTLTIATSSTVTPGSYALTITGAGAGKTRMATYELVILESPDFRIDTSPPSQTVAQGQTTSYSISVVGLKGFNSQVSLTISGLPPSGASSVFSIPAATPNFASTLTINVADNAPTGSYTLTITGSGGGINRIANVILVVNPAPQAQTQTQTSQSTQTSTPSQLTGLLDTIQQNSLILIIGLVLLVLVFGALALRGRGASKVPPSYQQTQPARETSKPKTLTSVVCANCGTENPATNAFCASCGRKLS